MKILLDTTAYTELENVSKHITKVKDKALKHINLNMYIQMPFQWSANDFHKNGYDDWIRIAEGTFNSEAADYQKQKDRYEGFIQGFLYYYEQHVISGVEKDYKDYTLYFDWKAATANGKYDLIVYLKSLENRIEEYNDYEQTVKIHKNYETTIEHVYLAPPPPSMTDPVKPPPPPPPTQL
jgi:hypothetical protein